MNNFLENFYGVLFFPQKTFNELKENPLLLQAFIIVVLASILNPIISFDASNIMSFIGLIFGLIGSAILGIIKWLFFAGFMELLAYVFNPQLISRAKIFLTLSGFALIPWFFTAPFQLLKSGGILGQFFAIALGLIVWSWATVLLIFALMKTYDLSIERVLILIVVPFLGGIIAFSWFIGFFTTFISLLKI